MSSPLDFFFSDKGSAFQSCDIRINSKLETDCQIIREDTKFDNPRYFFCRQSQT